MSGRQQWIPKHTTDPEFGSCCNSSKRAPLLDGAAFTLPFLRRPTSLLHYIADYHCFRPGLSKSPSLVPLVSRSPCLHPLLPPLPSGAGIALSAGGYFPDSTPNKPWKDSSPHAAADFWAARSQWYPSWKNAGLDSAMQVDMGAHACLLPPLSPYSSSTRRSISSLALLNNPCLARLALTAAISGVVGAGAAQTQRNATMHTIASSMVSRELNRWRCPMRVLCSPRLTGYACGLCRPPLQQPLARSQHPPLAVPFASLLPLGCSPKRDVTEFALV